MRIEVSKGTRKPKLELVAPDSGRTWCVQYDEIRRIPQDSLQSGDVLIVRHPTKEGMMFMQIIEPRPGVLEFEALKLSVDKGKSGD